jgi:hypothetical protein
MGVKMKNLWEKMSRQKSHTNIKNIAGESEFFLKKSSKDDGNQNYGNDI